MPRGKRSHMQAFEGTTVSGSVKGSEQQSDLPVGSMSTGEESRPKRARKPTQRFSNASSTTTATTTVKKRATNKGKGKARSTEQDEPPIATVETLADEPPKKKARTKKEGVLKEEKRLAQFKPHCPQKVLERAERVRTQRFFMIDRRREGKELKEEFKVLGSTANVYTVTIDHKPKCDCPDNRMGNHCKHIMFIFLKVLCVPISSHIWYQKALITSELESVFAAAPEAPNSVTNPRVRDAFLRATGQVAETSSAATSNKKRIPGEEDDCPICYDTMYQVAEKSLAFCEECGNALHKECFTQYEKSARQTGRAATCVWCRSEWGMKAPAPSAGSATQRGAFINLADAVGIDGHRDTSSYYHGPRQGQRYYGYNYYGE